MLAQPYRCARIRSHIRHGKQKAYRVEGTLTMLITTIALLSAFAGPMQATPSGGSDPLILVRGDSAHTLITPAAPYAGRSGQVYQLPQGGLGVSTGGTSYYQTLGTPGGGGVAVPNGNNTASYFGSSGRIGTFANPG
jgi:hypothetical protein